MKETTAVTTIPKWEMPGEPSWDRARELVGNVRRSVEDIIRLGIELHALREQWFASGQGGGGDRKSQSYKITSGQGCPEVIGKGQQIEFRDVLGWQRKIEAELGFSHKTASRIIERAQYTAMLAEVADGRPVKYVNTRNEEVICEPTNEVSRLSREALEDVVTGSKSPQRAWVGVTGEGKRLGPNGVRGKAHTDHKNNIKTALTKLRTSLKEWKKLSPADRHEIEELWSKVAKLLPDTWR
jgi:hypothetical protein